MPFAPSESAHGLGYFGRGSLAVRWIRVLALPVLILTLLAACQSNPRQRDFARFPSQATYQGGCGVHPCAVQRTCPPGYVLARIPLSYGGGRYCRPYSTRFSRCCGPPRQPVCLGSPGPCSQGRAARF